MISKAPDHLPPRGNIYRGATVELFRRATYWHLVLYVWPKMIDVVCGMN